MPPPIPHYPGRAPIEGYGRRTFRFAGMQHTGALLCLPSGIRAWIDAPADPVLIDRAALGPVFAEAGDIDILLVGTGRDIAPLSEALRFALRDAGIRADAMTTSAAARTWNVLVAEDRRVAAALLPVD